MYRMIDQFKEKSKDYRNKDLVLQALERENARCQFEEVREAFLIEELDKKGVVVFQEEVSLPFEGVAEDLFLQPKETKKEKSKKSSFFHRSSKPSFDEIPNQQSKEASKTATSAPIKEKKRDKSLNFGKVFLKFIFGAVITVSFVFSLLTVQLFFASQRQIRPLERQVRILKETQEKSGSLDTFSRYFLPYYFSSDGARLKPFLKKGLTIEAKQGQLQSVILEKISKTENNYHLTYVVALKAGEERKQMRLTLEMKEERSSSYGFVMTKKPLETQYP
ncbi:hypothetical protein KZA77_001860 [Streptococcus constellatus]|uniref:hypothetical protein n=1 Tax=Streptococcus constellatus TaxID=76860 RepID=UPI001C55FD4E|nr:hypothetical protein [Streptococcus constellatus]MBW3452046.1 hypothetical protein [Streptococcus constellatus]